MSRMKTISLLLCTLLGFVGVGRTQEITGSIVGTVHDQSGASIAGATISIQNADQNNTVVRVLTTNESGEYVAPFFAVGHYTLVAEAKDFKKVERRAFDVVGREEPVVVALIPVLAAADDDALLRGIR